MYVCVGDCWWSFCLGLPWQVKFLGNTEQQQPHCGNWVVKSRDKLGSWLAQQLTQLVCVGCVCVFMCVPEYLCVYECCTWLCIFALFLTLLSSAKNLCYLLGFFGLLSLSLNLSASLSGWIYDTAQRILHICTVQINFACCICVLRCGNALPSCK